MSCRNPKALAVILLVASAISPRAEALTVRGTVQRSGAEALAGAQVEVVPLLRGHGIVMALARSQPPAAPVVAARTDASGDFAVEVPAGVWQVRVVAAEFLPMRFVPLAVADSVELPPVILVPSVEASITVVDGSGEGVAEAGIHARSADADAWAQPFKSAWRPAPRQGRTDASGRLSLPRARGERLDVWAYLPGSTALASARSIRRATLRLEPPHHLGTLEVREANGDPVKDAVVIFRETALPVGYTGEHGALELHGRLTDPLELRLLAPGSRFQAQRLEQVHLEPPAAGDASPHVLTLAPKATLTGRILDHESKPVAGALVWPGHDPGAFIWSDATGRYTLEAGVGSRVRVQAHAPGFVTRSRKLTLDTPAPTPVDLVLMPAADLTGRVIDEAGEAVVGVRLEAVTQDARPPAIRLDTADGRARTDGEGRFALSNLTPGLVYTVKAARRGFGTSKLTVTAGSASQEDLKVVLRRGRLAFGRVLDLEERPLAGIEVRLRASESGEEGDGFTATSDPAGRFEALGLPASRLDVVATGQGFAPLVVRGIRVPADDGPVDLGTLLMAPGLSIRGRVVSRDGEPVAEALVRAVVDPQEVRRRSSSGATGLSVGQAPQTVADEQGIFVVEGLGRDRTVGLLADGAGYLPETLWGLEPPLEEGVTIVLRPASQIYGQVVDESDMPISGAEVSFNSTAHGSADGPAAESSSRSSTSGEAGRFTIEDAAPGTAKVEVFAEGFQPSQVHRLEVVEQQDVRDLRFVLVRGAVFEGRVTTADFEPVAEAKVTLGRPADQSDAEGLFRVEGIAPGRQLVAVEHPGYRRVIREVDVAPGLNAEDFVLEGGHRLSGRVVDASDLPLPAVEIVLEGADVDASLAPRTQSDDEGWFRLEPVAAGDYLVRARRAGYTEAERPQEIRIADGGVDDLEIRLRKGARIEGRILGLELDELSRVEIRATADGRRPRVGDVDFEGAYRISDLGSDDWTVRAFLPGGRREVRRQVTVEPGTDVASRDLEFGHGLSFTGQVLYGGEPLADTDVEVRSPLTGRRSVTTDFEGLFHFDDLVPGHYRLSLSNRRERLVHNDDLPLAQDRHVVIEIATAQLHGAVVDATTGDAVADAMVVLKQVLAEGREGSHFSNPTGGDGRFSYPRLTAGGYRLSVKAHGFQPLEQSLEIPAGAVLQDFSVRLDPAEGLEVNVVLASGRSPQYITLWGRDDAGRMFAETRPAYQGSVPFDTLPAGLWDLLIGATGGATVERRLSVPSEPVALVLPDAGRVRVRVPALVETDTVATLTVLGQDGRPFRHVVWGGALEEAWQVVGGRALVEGVPAGLWTFQVRLPDGPVWSESAVTTGGPDVEVRVE